MFTEYLQEHPLTEMLRAGTRKLYPAAEDRQAWDGIPEEYRKEIQEMAAAYGKIPYPLRNASGFLEFVRNGNRQADEKPYFTRRRKLCAAILNCCISPYADIDEVADGIWLLCEESSWVISAHNVNPVPGAPAPADYPLPDVRKPYIDLFSAQTGMILALAASMLGRRLDGVSPLIRTRISDEIRARILHPFMTTDDFWWMGFLRKDLNNWTPWIISNVMVCAVLDRMRTPKLAELLTRACGMLDRWLDVIPADGGCDEGPAYWNMAGGALLDCLMLLEKVTGGKMSFRENRKIRNILNYPLKMDMGNGWFANFADCDARPFISGERLETAGRISGNPALAALGTRMRGSAADQLSDVPHLTRVLDLLFHTPAGEQAAESGEKDEFLPDLQVRVLRKGRWMLACKGGNNGESHNHNDVGTFILSMDGEPAVVDAGNMVYTAKTFSPERYTLWNTRAGWHNVPMVGDREQREGTEHAARNVRCTPDGLELDLAAAYDDDAGVLQLDRSFALSPEGLRLTDEVGLQTAQPVTWVFLFRSRPFWKDGYIAAGGLTVKCPDGLNFTAEEIRVTDSRMNHSWPGSLWRVLLRSEPAVSFRKEFQFMANNREAE